MVVGGSHIIIYFVVLYGCESWSLTLREEHRMRVFENMVLRRPSMDYKALYQRTQHPTMYENYIQPITYAYFQIFT
jgi:hypothetical protein